MLLSCTNAMLYLPKDPVSNGSNLTLLTRAPSVQLSCLAQSRRPNPIGVILPCFAILGIFPNAFFIHDGFQLAQFNQPLLKPAFVETCPDRFRAENFQLLDYFRLDTWGVVACAKDWDEDVLSHFGFRFGPPGSHMGHLGTGVKAWLFFLSLQSGEKGYHEN